jgi:hypothetical protein
MAASPMTQEPSGAVARVFYRIVKTDPPMLLDFTSNQAQGKQPPRDPQKQRLWDGISVYEAEEQARATARRFPALGSYIVAVEIPAGSPGHFERTLKSAGHYMLWGGADYLLARVVSAVPV